jgi:thiol-disulfide isomerase/thioredoxin
MKTIALFCSALLFLQPLIASDEIKFDNATWAQVKEKAKRENKMIFFDAYATWCGPCKYMEESVYTEKIVADYYNANFINVKMDMEAGEGLRLSEEFNVTAYPTLLFFTPDGKMVHKYVGGMEAQDFIELGENSKDPEWQYFPLKARAEKNELNDEMFERWADQAKKMDDADLDVIVRKYIKAKGGFLADQSSAFATFYYIDLTEKEVIYLYANQAKIAKVMEWTAEHTTDLIYKKAFSLGLQSYEQYENNIDSFTAVFKRVAPKRAAFAKKDLQVLIALRVDEDPAAAMKLLSNSLLETTKKLTLEEIATLMIDNHAEFGDTEYRSFQKSLAAFKPAPSDKNKEFWLYLMQWMSYMKTADDDKALAAATKAYKHPAIPAEYKTILKEQYPDLK